MRIERMQLDDLETVTKLAAQIGYPNTEEAIQERFLAIHDQSQYALFVARQASGEVAGWLQINFEPMTLLVSPKAEIVALVVDERCRSQGVGKALLNHAENWARESGVTWVRVRSNVSRDGAHRFYEREGYFLTKTAHVFAKPF